MKFGALHGILLRRSCRGRPFGACGWPTVRSYTTGHGVEQASGMTAALLDRCRDAAVDRGINFEVPYEPYMPVDVMQTLFLDMHEAVGCSWTAALLLSVVCMRVITLPFAIVAAKGNRTRALIMPEYNRLMQQKQNATAANEINDVNKRLQAFTQQHGKFFMLRGMWNTVLIQAPMYLTAFVATRGLGNYPDVFVGFALEAPLWLESLAMPDPYLILPCMVSAVMVTNAEIFGAVDTEMSAAAPQLQQASSNQAVDGKNTQQKYAKWMLRGGSFVFIAMTWSFPSSYFIFMLANITLSTAQTQLLKTRTVERLLDLPPTPESMKDKGTVKGVRQPIAFARDKTDRTRGPTVRHTTTMLSLPPQRPEVQALLLGDGKDASKQSLAAKELQVSLRSERRPASELAQRIIGSIPAPA